MMAGRIGKALNSEWDEGRRDQEVPLVIIREPSAPIERRARPVESKDPSEW